MKNSQNKRRTGRAGVVLIAILVMLVGAGIMLYPRLTDLRYSLFQSRLAADASDSRQGDGIALPDGSVALLEIPAIDFEAYVLEGTSRSALAKGPGHYLGTPLPGEDGNSAIAGHRTMYGHPFQDLDRLQPGDEIFTATAGGSAVYRVVRVVVVHPTELSVVAQTATDHLTLTTCHPKGSAAQRLVVVAERTG